jgi:ABC-type branched-subunit amino acid transport system substrate-binding protein
MVPRTGQTLTQPEKLAAVKAAVDTVNANGGIGGRQLELKSCDTHFVANDEITCMRDLIKAGVVAVVGPTLSSDQAGTAHKLASSAGIPIVGSAGSVPIEFTTPGIYPVTSGTPGWIYGAIDNMIAHGATKIAFIGTYGVASAEFGIDLANQAMKAAGLEPVTGVLANSQADPTLASAAAKAVAGGVDGIFLFVLPQLLPTMLTALKNASYDGLRASITQAFGPAAIKAVGDDANGILVTGQAAFASNTRDQDVQAMLAGMKKYAPDALLTEQAMIGWSAVQLLKQVMKNSTEEFTSKGIKAAFDGLEAPVKVGTVGPFGPPPETPVLKGYDRMFSPYVQNGVIKNGVSVPDGKGFIDAF